MSEIAALQAELSEARRLLDARTRHGELAQRRMEEARADARALAQQNDRLNQTLREARDTIVTLRQELEALASPPNTFARVVRVVEDALADVASAGRVVRVAVSPEVAGKLAVGASVLLNEASMVIGVAENPVPGDLAHVREVLGDGRALVAGSQDDDLVVLVPPSLDALEVGSWVLIDRRAGVVVERVTRDEVPELQLEETPDVSWEQIGGLGEQIEQIRDAIELPVVHRDLFADYELKAPKGVLLYGPPGCGKTMIAKAVASSVGSYFLNIKGPELLNKYVGETERQIRAIFSRARELASRGRPVIVFFDEMDSLFRTRGSGVSSDVESTVVPQMLSEIDGVEGLENVIVIGATNREDLIDPAILRPGRLDVKIKLDRPGPDAAAEILRLYLGEQVPLDADGVRAAGGAEQFRTRLVERVVEQLFVRDETTQFVEVTFASGARQVLYVGDFVSGALLANVIARAKKLAIKQSLSGGASGLAVAHLDEACRDEIRENEELANTTNPDDWARVSGRKGERIVFMRTLRKSRALPVE